MMQGTTNETSQDQTRIVLRTEHLGKKFGALVAVDDLELAVLQGEVFGLLGPNGAGKSTTINMICGLVRPSAGTIYLYGQALPFGSSAFNARIGVCPQELVFWPKLTCLEQLEFIGTQYDLPRTVAHRRGQQLLRDLGLYEKRNQLAGTLSGGMQRRLNLLLALVHDPELVILDEPEAGLDPQSRVLVREYIRALARHKTVIFTTHNMDEAERVCDRVAIIDHGKLLRLDTPEHLKHTIGTGSVLEIQVGTAENLARVVAELQQLALQAVQVDHTLVVRGPDVVTLLPQIVDRLKTNGIPILELKLRENTLEDVFIALTGRRLRE